MAAGDDDIAGAGSRQDLDVLRRLDTCDGLAHAHDALGIHEIELLVVPSAVDGAGGNSVRVAGSKGPPSGAPPGAVSGRSGSAECGSPGRRSCPSPGTPAGRPGRAGPRAVQGRSSAAQGAAVVQRIRGPRDVVRSSGCRSSGCRSREAGRRGHRRSRPGRPPGRDRPGRAGTPSPR